MIRTIHSSIAFLTCLFLSVAALGQNENLPTEWYVDEAAHQLTLGDRPVEGFYRKDVIRSISLQFNQPNYWQELIANDLTNTRILATLTVDGVMYDSVGVRFKGGTSQAIDSTSKRSFNISTDHYRPEQTVMGYNTILLDNWSNDASALRQVMYSDIIRDHVPVAKANFSQLTINGVNFGVYTNIQQTNSPYLREWFPTNNGSLWRAERPDGLDVGFWGDGTAGMNYLGMDTAIYQLFYTLERSEQNQPWDHLVRVINKLNNTPQAVLYDSLELYMNVDRALWFLASEIAFGDRDSYVRKGKNDYLLYQESQGDRMQVMEVDGRSTMQLGDVDWSAFHNADDPAYPLLNKLLAVPQLRQRYLAHMRTLIAEQLDVTAFEALQDEYMALIDQAVQSDNKKLFTYAQYLSENQELVQFISEHRDSLLNEAEVVQVAPTISVVEQRVNGFLWGIPYADQNVDIRANVTSTSGIQSVNLYYCAGMTGRYTRTTMFDDGLHGDGAAGDGTYGASIPPTPAQVRVRYYVEALANNAAKSARYDPPGAEHDVYTYMAVHPTMLQPSVRINEVMAWNLNTVTDNFGDPDDWIEFHNLTGQPVDLTGHWLSDRGTELQMWQFPGGSIIQPNGYVIIWADEDLDQGDGHANFRLAFDGEEVWLTTPQGVVMDHVIFGPQLQDMGFARVPNGTGPFLIQAPTFAADNGQGNGVLEIDDADALVVYPNPATDSFIIRSTEPMDIVIHDALARQLWAGRVTGSTSIDVANWAAGSYYIRHNGGVRQLVVIR